MSLYVIKRPQKLWLIDNYESIITPHPLRTENLSYQNSTQRGDTSSSSQFGSLNQCIITRGTLLL